jgi:LuxR family maltose regulon positive regulatory protein
VTRPRLFARLDQGAPVTIVRGPAGFGKTTLVAHWLTQRSAPAEDVLWLTADGPHHLWADLAAGLRRRHLAEPADDTAIAVQRSLRAIDRPLLVVVDRADELSERAELDPLRDLVRHTRRLRLLICARRRPPTVQVGGDSATVIADDLLFSPAETRELPPGHPLTAPWARALHDQTGGWPALTVAAARLLADDLHDDPEARVDHELVVRVSRSCVRAVLDHRVMADGPNAAFARAVAVVPLVDVELAEQLTDDTNAAERLDRLADEGLLIGRLESGRLRYRWLEAARQLLLERLPPVAIRALHVRAAGCHARRAEPANALDHAVRGQDWALSVDVIEQFWPRLVVQHTDVLDPALDRIPLAAFVGRSRAVAARDIRMQLTGRDPGNALTLLPSPLLTEDDAIDALARSDGALVALSTWCALMAAFRVRGDLSTARRHAEAVESLIRTIRARLPAGEVPRLADALVQVGLTFLIGGDLERASLALEDGYALRREGRGLGAEADAAASLALLHALSGDPSAAERWLSRFRAAPEPSGWMLPRIRHAAELARGLIAVERLDDETSTGILRRLEREVTAEHSWYPFLSYLHAQHALLWGDRYGALSRLRRDRDRDRHWLQGPATMRALLDNSEADLLLALGLGTEARALLAAISATGLTAARLRLHSGDAAGAAGVAADTLRSSATTPRARADLLLIAAVAHSRLGHRGAALDDLRNAVDCARVTTAVRAFATVPRPELLALAEDMPPAAALLDHPMVRLAPVVFPETLDLVELTEREETLLAELDAGSNLPEIAAQLSISYNTVKSHARSLYRKLGANSRDQALGRARALGLLASLTEARDRPSPDQRRSGR